MKILLTSTSFQDSPGRHHQMLENTGFSIDRLRGPLPERDLLDIVHQYDGIICSDDQYTDEVIRRGKAGKLKIISKYGVGLDSINLEAARKYGVKVTNCPDVNQITVAEHVFALLLTFFRNVHHEYNATTMQGNWIRTIGHDLYGKHLGIVGLGRIGKELAKRAVAFGVTVSAYDPFIDEDFISRYKITRFNALTEMVAVCDIISLHLPLKQETERIFSSDIIKNHIKHGLYLVNTSRAKLVDREALIQALKAGRIAGYMTDVAEVEPIAKDHPLIGMENVIITSHVGSRTYENIERQGIMAVENLLNALVVN